MKLMKDAQTPYPRLCSHRGFHTAAPENTLPAFAMAVALGAEEIEFDLWPSKDGDLFVCHDPAVDRTTDGKGLIAGLTTKELRALDAGSHFSPRFRGVRLPLFEEMLDQFGGRAIFNIHIKSPLKTYVQNEKMDERKRRLHRNYAAPNGVWPMEEGIEETLAQVENRNAGRYDEGCFRRILDALDRYRLRESVYITGEKDVLETARDMAPELPRCCLEGHMNFSIVDNAVKYGCKKAQFCKGLTTQKMIDQARAAGLILNLFWSDIPEEARYYLNAGIDCLLVNDLMALKGMDG